MSLMEIAMRRANGGALAQAMAAVAATVTAVAVFLMPAGVLEQAVLASGMADVLAPLQPPLGTRARLGLSLTAAGSAFGMVLLLMRLTGAAGTPRPAKTQDEALPAPRLRRRDRHPDAPARAPLSAHRDLGDPVFEEEEAEAEPAPEPTLAVTSPVRERAPGTRRRAPLIEILGAAEQEAQGAQADAGHPLRRIKAGRHAEPAAAPELAAPDPALAAEAPSEPVESAPAPEPQPVSEQVPEPQPQPDPVSEPEPEPVAAKAEPTEPAPAEAEPVRLEPVPAAPASAKQQDLSELMARLERAMERKTARRQAAPAPAAAADAEDSTDRRLRSALENLKRFAPGRG